MEDREKTLNVCPECSSNNLIRDSERAEVTCLNCGLVISERMTDPGPEWRAFNPEQKEKRTRVGAPLTLTIHDKGLSTVIDWRDKDIYGKDLTPKKRAQVYRLRRWQRRIRISDATERNLAAALQEIERITSQLGLPKSVHEEAALIYRKAAEEKLVRGRSIESMAAAAVYAACRRYNIPRTLEEITKVSRVSKKDIGRSYRFMAKELLRKINPTSPVEYIPRLVSQLGLVGDVQTYAKKIVDVARESGLTSGRGPVGVAAAAIYIASVILSEKKTQKEIAYVAGVTEVTIRNRYKELTEKILIDIPI
ncbi:MAG: transcription initiation factor IIB [Candidatus Methanomethylicia archaeon]|nr:transcription initiation factor IIB [Candidatus Methanomethylicia archaeon]MCX8169216.1 transcription initiation factor IIB [Candidatus Methanomethylicia archaeon]MDW7989002.1 transcription initiation factor IIB [Nitrososphaerota archaeon]